MNNSTPKLTKHWLDGDAKSNNFGMVGDLVIDS